MRKDFLTIPAQKAYTVRWYDAALEGIPDLLFLAPSQWIIITEDTIYKAAKDKIDAIHNALEIMSPTNTIIIEGDKEAIKTIDTVMMLCSKLITHKADRRTVIIAIGGGVIGDIAGFVANIYKRGIRYVQIPTTIIGQADSCIGGKTGVNTTDGKNIIGTFYNPSAVIIGYDVLETLPLPLYKTGYAEIIKYALIGDEPMARSLEENKTRWMNKEKDYIMHLTNYALRQKAKYVAQDYQDKDTRQLLNFGHTFGHALEKISGYTLSHGDAVAIGMVMAFEYAVHLGVCPQEDAAWVIKHLHTMGLPTKATFDSKALLKAMEMDKKNMGDGINLILVRGIGNAYIHKVADENHLYRWLEKQ